MSEEEKEMTPYTVDNYHMADWKEKQRYWVEVYRQRSQVAENEMRKEVQKLRQAATAHDVPYLSHNGRVKGVTMNTYVGAPVLRSYCLLGAHKSCARCERITLVCQNIGSYKNVYMRWKKKANQMEDALNGVDKTKKQKEQKDNNKDA